MRADFGGCIERWKQDLLDVSGRNRALYYRQVQGTVELQAPEEKVWGQLAAGTSLPLTPDLLVREEGLEDRDRALEEVRKRLRRLIDTNRTYLEEQGVHVLHVVAGWLTWPDQSRVPGQRDTTVQLPDGRRVLLVRSPIIFVPVLLSRKGNDFQVELEPDVDSEVNAALLHLLRAQYQVAPSIDPDEEASLDHILDEFRRIASGRNHWSVHSGLTTLLDTFSFKKIALYRELERSQARVQQQPLLRALCGDAEPLLARGSLPAYESLDDEVRADDLALTVPADASQMKAILSVKAGRSLVIQGPPGTGKSQTITNLISTLVADRKRVLFVAEKRAARDIVVGNLIKSGLGEIVLHLTEEVSGARVAAQAKSEILKQLGALLEKGPHRYEGVEDAVHQFEDVKAELNAYVRALHQPVGKGAWSKPFALIARLSECPETEVPRGLPELPQLSDVTPDWLEKVVDRAQELDDLEECVLEAAAGPWQGTRLTHVTAAQAATIRSALEVLKAAPEQLGAVAREHGAHAMQPDGTPAEVQALRALLIRLSTYNRLRDRWYRWLVPRYLRARASAQAFVKNGGRLTASEGLSASRVQQVLRDAALAHAAIHDALPSLAPFDEVTIRALADRAHLLEEGLRALPDAARVRSVLGRLEDRAAARLLEALLAARKPGQPLAVLTRRAVLERWVEEALGIFPELNVTAPVQERRRTRFLNADGGLRSHALASALNGIAPTRPGNATPADPASPLGYLRGAVNARRRPALRRIFARSARAIQEVVPCIVASPLAVAQFLHAEDYQFDFVIFDEASQIPVGDAIVPISRAAEVVVTGDSQQMPPTSFFDRGTSEVADQDADDSIEDFESILQQCDAILPNVPLQWHYRSQDERLIAFSNRNFYAGNLLTFPASWAEHPELGVKLAYVENAVYGRGGSRANPQEAEEALEILRHESQSNPTSDVRITAMSIAQSAVLQETVDRQALVDPVVRRWVEGGGRVKNLETVQGDECDVMILCLGYGKDGAGNLQANFGPLSRENGYRRLNVAVTRARRKTVVVASIRAGDIPTTVGAGGRYVRAYLDYAERGPIALLAGETAAATSIYDSPFEEEIGTHLRGLGWHVDTQVGVSRYRIDLAVRDPRHPGRYLAGIECDGAAYHSAETARDRDIGRQAVLERLGWRIIRIWSPEWLRNRLAVIDRVDKELRRLADEMEPKGMPESPPPQDTAAEPQEPPSVAINVHSLSQTASPDAYVEYGLPDRYPADPQRDMQKCILWLVTEYGPLHRDELVDALRKRLGYGRLGKRIRPWLEQQLQLAIRSRKVEPRGVFWIWPSAMDPSQVPVRRNTGPNKRRFEWYSDEELLRAAELIPVATRARDGERFGAQVARSLGYERVSDAMKGRFLLLFNAHPPWAGYEPPWAEALKHIKGR